MWDFILSKQKAFLNFIFYPVTVKADYTACDHQQFNTEVSRLLPACIICAALLAHMLQVQLIHCKSEIPSLLQLIW